MLTKSAVSEELIWASTRIWLIKYCEKFALHWKDEKCKITLAAYQSLKKKINKTKWKLKGETDSRDYPNTAYEILWKICTVLKKWKIQNYLSGVSVVYNIKVLHMIGQSGNLSFLCNKT